MIRSHIKASLGNFLIVFGVCYLLETMTMSYIVTSIQSIERQFKIRSGLAGLIVSFSEIGYTLAVVVLAYLGGKGNRPRWIGAGCILIALSCVFIASPHIFFEYKTSKSNVTEIARIIARRYMVSVGELDTPSKFISHWSVAPHIMTPSEQLIFNESSMDDFASLQSLLDLLPAQYIERLSTVVPPGYNASDFHRLIAGDEPHLDIASILMSDHILLARQDSGLVKRDAWPQDVHVGRRTALLVGNESFAEFSALIVEEINAAVRALFTSNHTSKVIRAAQLPFLFCNQIMSQAKVLTTLDGCRNYETNNGAVIIIVLGMALIGVGHSMPWTLGVPLIDDCVKKEDSPLYFAGIFFIRIMGPVFGFVLGAVCNSIHVTLTSPPGLNSQSPQWVGAWWLGFVLIALLLTAPSVVLAMFPKLEFVPSTTTSGDAKPQNLLRDDGAEQTLLSTQEQTLQLQQPTSQESVIFKEIRSFIASVVITLKTPIYTALVFSRILDVFSMRGLVVFQPKYLESHYGITPEKANVLIGIVGVAAFAFGTASGSLLPKGMKFRARWLAFWCFLCSLTAAMLCFSFTFLSCQSVVNSIYHPGRNSGTLKFNFTNGCNANCGCEPSGLLPVCSANGTQYFSPCHAGCRNASLVPGKKDQIRFTNCECIDVGTEVKYEWCHDNCFFQAVLYFTIIFISAFISGTTIVPSALLLLRSIRSECRSIGLGLSSFIVGILSVFPSPIAFGYIIDSACLSWALDCTNAGNCEVYDPEALRNRLFLFSGSVKVASVSFDLLVWYYSKGLNLLDQQHFEPETEESEMVPLHVQKPKRQTISK